MSSRPLLIAQLDAMHQSRGGDWYYRTFAPGRALAERPGVHVVSLDQAHRFQAQLLERANVLILNSVCDPDLLSLIQRRKEARRVTVFELSDDVSAVTRDNPVFAFFSAPDNLRLFRRLAQACDAVQYSVPELKRCFDYLNPRGRVFENQLVTVPPLRDAASADPRAPLTIGWGGSNGHFDDVADIAGPLMAVVARHSNVTLHLMCSERIWHLFDDLAPERKRRTPPGSLEDYYRFVGGLDVGVAPLRDNGFNRSRSDVKLLEYAAYGAAPVVQSLTPYLESVEPGVNALLFRSPGELVQHLERLLTSPEERLFLRERAHRYVADQRRLDRHVDERLRFYDELLQDSRASSGAEQEQTFAELCAWEGVERHDRHAVLGHTRFEQLLYEGLRVSQVEGASQRARALFQAANALLPRHFLPRLLAGCQLECEDELLAALEAEPRSVRALLSLGWLELKRNDPKPALGRFLAAAELSPAFEQPYTGAASAVRMLGAAKEAAEFERIAEQLAGAVEPPRRASL